MKPKLSFPIPNTPEFNPEEISGISKKYLDVPYADASVHQVYDLYLPRNKKGKIPLIIYLHEGAFAFGSKRDRRAETLFAALQRGYGIASVDYRSSSQVTWPAPVFDVKAAIRCLRARAEEYDLDSECFTIWGLSAGAYYASLTAVTGDNPGFEDLSMGYPKQNSRVQAAVDFSGACAGFHHLDTMIQENGLGRANHDLENSPESILMGNPLQEIRELNHLAAPITYVNQDTPPFFILHCETDPVVPVQQSKAFAQAIREKAGPEKVKVVFTQGEADHGKPDYNTSEMIEQALDFLDGIFDRPKKEE